VLSDILIEDVGDSLCWRGGGLFDVRHRPRVWRRLKPVLTGLMRPIQAVGVSRCGEAPLGVNGSLKPGPPGLGSRSVELRLSRIVLVEDHPSGKTVIDGVGNYLTNQQLPRGNYVTVSTPVPSAGSLVGLRAWRSLSDMSQTAPDAPPLASIERPYEFLPLAVLVERAEAQYGQGRVSFEVLAELVARAEAGERSQRRP
jgi:hypothetical protein